MCGIGGVFADAPSRELLPAVVRLMKGLRHRGPDGEGFWSLGESNNGLVDPQSHGEAARIVLGHRRLSIVDPRGGQQPLSNEDGTVWVSFNGEIYNQLTIRKELEAAGHRFRTTCDTEVLVHGWEEWGTEMFGRLNGIFALAIADVATCTVVLARDPLGVKPLFVGQTSEGLTWWSSELGAASAAGLARPRYDIDALKLFLWFRFVPSPWSVYSDVSKVPPGHFARVSGRVLNHASFEPYECRVRSTLSPRTEGEWGAALVAELEAAVTRQLMSDVPVGALLSGGIDSSLVTAMMLRGLPAPPMTFGIGFTSRGDVGEAAAAQRAAAALGVPHESVLVEIDQYPALWRDALRFASEPLANSGGALVQLLCRHAASAHKVVLTGQGADEPLGGYPRHVMERIYPLARRAPVLFRLATRYAWGAENGSRLAAVVQSPDRASRFANVFRVFDENAIDRYVPGGSTTAAELARHAIVRWLADDPTGDPVNEMLGVDMRMSLADDLLMVADSASMRESVELRVPFLDLALVELVGRMPSRFKISRIGARKWLYRRAAATALPNELKELQGIRARLGRKHGFDTPLAELTASELRAGGPPYWAGDLERLPLNVRAIEQDLARPTMELASARERAALLSLAVWASSV